MDKVKAVLGAIFRHWGKILLTVLLTIVFVVAMFPLNDVNDLVTNQVYRGTGNKVYLQFEELNMALFPSPGLAMGQISLEASPLPPISIRRLELRPSLLGLLLQRIEAEAKAEGIFRGDITASVKPGKKMENGAITQAVSVEAVNLNLAEIRKVAQLPVQARGTLGLTADGHVDLSFSNQPDITLDLTSNSFELMPSTVETPLGPLSVPELKLGKLQLRGRLSAGQMVIEDGQIGTSTDELNGTLKGRLGLEMRMINGIVVPIATNYEFNVNLSAKKSFEERASMFLLLIQNHRQPEGENGRYKFTLIGNAQTQQFNFAPPR